MPKSFFFYDLETSGLNPREDRIMQFAGQRTDLDLNPIGEPVNLLVKLPDDTLPSPSAVFVTKISPQKTLLDGISEVEFAKIAATDIFTPHTISVGFNTVRFDDEFMRHLFWRNFHDPYEWQWKDGRSRWDLLDVIRLTRTLRPEGINWPVVNGQATNRLELITSLNGLEHTHAHDALSDVFATIAVARLIKEKQPDLFNYLFELRDKKAVKKLVNLELKQPFVYASGRYSVEHEKTTVAFPLTSARNGNLLVFDLRYNLDELLANRQNIDEDKPSSNLQDSNSTRLLRMRQNTNNNLTENISNNNPAQNIDNLTENTNSNNPAQNINSDNPAKNANGDDLAQDIGSESTKSRYFLNSFYPIIKEFCFNKCPAVAPLGVLNRQDGWQKIHLDQSTIKKNLESLLSHPEFAENMREQAEHLPDFPPAPDPESALYDGFLNDRDRTRCEAVKNATPSQLVDFSPDFTDERLPDLLIHYKARNFPTTLTESEQAAWASYRLARLKRQTPKFLDELKTIFKKDSFLAEELNLYFGSLFDLD